METTQQTVSKTVLKEVLPAWVERPPDESMVSVSRTITALGNSMVRHIAALREAFAVKHLDKLGLCSIHEYPHRWEQSDEALELTQEVVLCPIGTDDIGPFEEARKTYPHETFRTRVLIVPE